MEETWCTDTDMHFLKTAAVDYSKARMDRFLKGEMHAMDCIIPIYKIFEELNDVECSFFVAKRPFPPTVPLGTRA